MRFYSIYLIKEYHQLMKSLSIVIALLMTLLSSAQCFSFVIQRNCVIKNPLNSLFFIIIRHLFLERTCFCAKYQKILMRKKPQKACNISVVKFKVHWISGRKKLKNNYVIKNWNRDLSRSPFSHVLCICAMIFTAEFYGKAFFYDKIRASA